MVTALRVACNVSTYRIASLCARGFTSSTSLQSTSDASDAKKPSRKRTVTKKDFADLPKALLQADGSLAASLGEWEGGLGARKAVHLNDIPVASRPSEELGAGTSNTSYSSDASIRIAEARKDTAADEDSLFPGNSTTKDDAQHESENAPKRRRGRRRKAEAIVEESSPPEATFIPQPKNRLASEILDNLTKFPHCILLTRVGQFYESYFDQAKEVANYLNIKLAQRTWDGRRIWMCGFPLMHLDKYLKILVQDQKRFVALCEEFPRFPHLGAKGGFDRRVVRIVTPGTLIDEPFLNPYENNYLLAVACVQTSTSAPAKSAANEVGLAWMDISTGEFFTKTTPLESLRDELVRISPREVVLDKDTMFDESHPVRQAIWEEGYFTSYFSSFTDVDLDIPTHASEGDSGVDDVVPHLDFSRDEPGSLLTDPEASAVRLLTAFMRANLLEHMPTLSSPSRETAGGRMQIDAHTIKALEIREGLSDGGATGSLLSVMKRTVTGSGTRLLARWLCSPSTSLSEINARQSLVAFFYARPHLREDLVQSLDEIEDATRIVQKFLLGRGQPNDLSAICSTIRAWASIKERIVLEKTMEKRERGSIQDEEWDSIDALLRGMHDLEHLAESMENAVTVPSGHVTTPETRAAVEPEDPAGSTGIDTMLPTQEIGTTTGFSSYNWTIRPGFSPKLAELHTTLSELLDRRQRLERRLQITYGAPSLTLRSSPGQGMHVHIGRGKRDSSKIRASALFIPLSTNKTASSFFLQEWSQLGSQIVETTTAIYIAEKEAFEVLRNQVSAHSNHLRRNSRIMDEMDVTIAFAKLAVQMGFVRPIVNESTIYHVANGRHPTVELGLLTAGRTFTPNTVTLTPTSHLHIITGPNMAGKSTLLRQTALISILAQSGSFVPADSAEIGIVDRVFSRVGARDDLFRDRSTFMVEMLETSEILRRATPQSLVIMDEVGRGTTVDDGLAIAFATVHHLLTANHCRALFATHFHELADMLGCSDDHRGEGPFANVGFFCTDIDETKDGYFSYSHCLKPGVNRDSHGLKVAQLAKMPDSAVEVAQTALSWLKDRSARVTDADALGVLGKSLASR